MREIDDPQFSAELTWGIPLEGLEQRLRPDHTSGVGFLGEHESLLEVVHSDWQVVQECGTTHNQIAEALEDLLKGQGRTTAGFEFRTKDAIEGIRTEVLGYQKCPWECSQMGKTIGVIASAQTFQEREREISMAALDFFVDRSPDAASKFVVVTGLLPHLIRQHYFFEGRQSPYRADPTLLIQAFGLNR